MLKLLPLLSKKLEDLTLDDLTLVRDFLKIDVPVTDELKNAGIALLKGNDIHSVADMIKSPDSIQQLMSIFVKPPAPEPMRFVVRCPHCEAYFIN